MTLADLRCARIKNKHNLSIIGFYKSTYGLEDTHVAYVFNTHNTSWGNMEVERNWILKMQQ